MGGREVVISNRDYWFKVVAMLQQNWALIETDLQGSTCTVYFIHDRSGVFDSIRFDTIKEAIEALERNGFSRYTNDIEAQKLIRAPEAPFLESAHPNGPIYSSGRFWK